MLTARTFVDRLLASGIATPHTIIGCNEQEIRAIEMRLQVQLPESYKEFLRGTGKCAGYLNLTDYYPEVMELNEKARRLLLRCEGANLELPEKAFVYSMVPSEAFLFFDTADASANPPIFGYYERDGKFKRVADSFWDQLETDFAQAEVLEKKHPEHSLLPAIRAEERAREIRARMANRTNLEFARELVH